MNSRKHSKTPPLPIEQWDFRGIDNLPAEHLYFCLTYEYAREVKCIREAFEADKKTGRHFDEHGNWHFVLYVEESIDELGLDRMELAFERIDAPPGFPDKPYLDTDHIITDNAYVPFSPPALQRPTPPVVSVTWNGQNWVADQEPCPYEHVHFLAINWIAPDTNLKNAFAKWLEVNRPAYISIRAAGDSGLRKACGIPQG
jgi:hypothetical protein